MWNALVVGRIDLKIPGGVGKRNDDDIVDQQRMHRVLDPIAVDWFDNSLDPGVGYFPASGLDMRPTGVDMRAWVAV